MVMQLKYDAVLEGDAMMNVLDGDAVFLEEEYIRL